MLKLGQNYPRYRGLNVWTSRGAFQSVGGKAGTNRQGPERLPDPGFPRTLDIVDTGLGPQTEVLFHKLKGLFRREKIHIYQISIFPLDLPPLTI